jgi:hypothetical protein
MFPLAGVVSGAGLLTFQEYSVQELELQPLAHPPFTRILILFTVPVAVNEGTVADVVDQFAPLSVEYPYSNPHA